MEQPRQSRTTNTAFQFLTIQGAQHTPALRTAQM